MSSGIHSRTTARRSSPGAGRSGPEDTEDGSQNRQQQAEDSQATEMTVPVTPTNRHEHGGPDPKRRKLRKGTHSCWGCKRRKVRCTFSNLPPGCSIGDALTEADLQGAVCDGCRRRGTTCVSQDVPETLAQETPANYERYQADGSQPRPEPDNQTQTDSRLSRIEALVETLAKKLDRHVSAVPAGEFRTSSGVTTAQQRSEAQESNTDIVDDEDLGAIYNSWPDAGDPPNGQPPGTEQRQGRESHPRGSTAPLGLPTPAESSAETERPTYTTWFGHQSVIEDEVPRSAAVPSGTPAAATVLSVASGSDTVLGSSPAYTSTTPNDTAASNNGDFSSNKQYMDKYNGLIAAWPSKEDLQTLVHILSEANKRKGRLAVISGPTSTVLAANNPPVNLRDVRDLLVVPPAGTHLALVALKLLTIALSLQHLDAADPADLEHSRRNGQSPIAETPSLAARLHAPPRQLMQAAVDAADTLVVSHECLIGSLEGVHCLVLVGIYQANMGNLRRAWLAVRKAMIMAQLMGMQRTSGDISGSSGGSFGDASTTPALACLDPTTRDLLPPRCLWFRIVFADRYLSLMLGLPQGVPGDQAVTSSSTGRQRVKMMETLAMPVFGTDTDEARKLNTYVADARQRLWQIEYRHAIIVGRILERNEAWRGDDEDGRDAWEDGDEDDSDEGDDNEDGDILHADVDNSRLSTEAIDWALQRTSRSMPAQWWQTPSAEELEAHDGAFAFLVTQRVVDQLFHYHLLAQLHLPFMLRKAGSPGGRTKDSGPPDSADRYAYSKITCVSASREVLTRFLSLRGLRCSTVSCRSVDFFALLASMTLCLAHLDSHGNERAGGKKTTNENRRRSRGGPPARPGLPSFLAHQRHSDRGMMERVLETMETHACAHPDDALAHKSVAFLRHLLAIEEAASLMSAAAKGNGAAARQLRATTSASTRHNNEALRMWVPYLGTIRLSREGIVRVRNHAEETTSGTTDTAPRERRSSSHAAPPSSSMVQTPARLQQPSTTAPALPSNVMLATGQDGPQVPGLTMYTSGSFQPDLATYAGQSAVGTPWAGDSNSVLQYNPYVPNAQGDDYTLQGVDLAFFENLLMHSAPDDLAMFEPASLPTMDLDTMGQGQGGIESV